MGFTTFKCRRQLQLLATTIKDRHSTIITTCVPTPTAAHNYYCPKGHPKRAVAPFDPFNATKAVF
eukprot:5648082-Karenia_brevis.AAC.1